MSIKVIRRIMIFIFFNLSWKYLPIRLFVHLVSMNLSLLNDTSIKLYRIPIFRPIAFFSIFVFIEITIILILLINILQPLKLPSCGFELKNLFLINRFSSWILLLSAIFQTDNLFCVSIFIFFYLFHADRAF